MAKYIYQHKSWPNFTWDEKQAQVTLGKGRLLQGRLFGQFSALGFSEKQESQLSNISLEVFKNLGDRGRKT